MKGIKIKLLSAAICVILTLGVVLAIRGFSFFVNLVEDFRGYDYEAKIAKGYDWVGPKRGEIVDTSLLLNSDDVPLSKIQKKDLLVLTVVDPECGACKITRDQFRFLSENLKENGIGYYTVTFSPNVSPVQLSEYVKSLGLNSDSLAWSNGLETVLPSLKSIAYPTHILIDSNGAVIKSFPGTSYDKNVRDRMVREVVRQVIDEKNRSNSEH